MLLTKSFEENGYARVIVASSSLSMGVDFPHVSYVLHYGPSKTLSSHLQEAGRAGRDGRQAHNIIAYLPKHLVHCEKEVKGAVKKGLNECARIAFYQHFDEHVESVEPLHNCCGTCHRICKCASDDHCAVPLYDFDSLPTTSATVDDTMRRKATRKDKDCVESALKELQMSLSHKASTSLLDPFGFSVHGLTDALIRAVVRNSEKIFTVSDVGLYCPVVSVKLSLMILEVLNEIFEDITVPDELYSTIQESELLTSNLQGRNPSAATVDNMEFDFDEFHYYSTECLKKMLHLQDGQYLS